uniref:Uncharacterized protein n=1 Tax=Glossina pallidipes TaxID=7398 RepID=A0A1A9ZQ53_GLOPL
MTHKGGLTRADDISAENIHIECAFGAYFQFCVRALEDSHEFSAIDGLIMPPVTAVQVTLSQCQHYHQQQYCHHSLWHSQANDCARTRTYTYMNKTELFISVCTGWISMDKT